MATYEKADHGPYVALAMLFGIAAGIGAGMLLAPRSGEEMRRKLRDKAMSAKEQARNKMMARRNHMSEAVDTAIDKTSTAVDTAIEKADKATDKALRRAKDTSRHMQQDDTVVI
jgi:gas vesicle protein